MRFTHIVMIFFICLNISNANQLKNETSPYLKQHASNPINWYPWSEEAFKKAQKEDKLIFLSIGYSTCHWCHVMAEESFQDKELAKLFNKYYISIKVDKEEMPHLDSHYQNLFKKLNGYAGGWPLNIFMSADKEPFYMAAYIPAKSANTYQGFDTLLNDLYNKYKSGALSVMIQATTKESKVAKLSIESFVEIINENYDDLSIGFGTTTKFPEASKIHLMLDIAQITDSKEMYDKSFELLDTMALKGLYDHIDGGFSRYVVDSLWEIPHFEKMLYTQAEMIKLYSRAYAVSGKDLYKDIVKESIAMCDRRFLKDDLYFSASDAGTLHDEGKYFVFDKDELSKALSKNSYEKEIKKSLGDSTAGNFLDGFVHIGFVDNERPEGFDEFRDSLKKIRDKREYPFIDKKINTAWNALMIEALYEASSLDKRYALKADKHLARLKEYMFDKGELYHQALYGHKPKQSGFLEDYSFMISALLSGYKATLDESKLLFAQYLLKHSEFKFNSDSVWYLNEKGERIKADLADIHYISALSNMIQNMLRFAYLKHSKQYEKKSKKTLDTLRAHISSTKLESPALVSAYLMQKYGVGTFKTKQKLYQTIYQNSLDKIRKKR